MNYVGVIAVLRAVSSFTIVGCNEAVEVVVGYMRQFFSASGHGWSFSFMARMRYDAI